VSAGVLNRHLARIPKFARLGYHRERGGGCPHVLSTFVPVSDRSSFLSRALYPCTKPAGHRGAHHSKRGEWT
jgi:hypothetical protein